MAKSIAFLRAINVGGHVVKMARLSELFRLMGHEEVETFIASGNVIFDSRARSTKALENKIEKVLEESLGYRVVTFVRTPDELVRVVDFVPFPAEELRADGSTLYIGFLKEGATAEGEKKLAALASERNRFRAHGRELYWLITTRFSDSDITGSKLEKALGQAITIRNVTTVRKLAAKYGP